MKIAVGEKVAGKFQYNRFAALMNNSDYYQKAYSATQNSDGMVDQMQDAYADSIEGRLNSLQSAGEQIITTLFDQDNIEPILGQATNLLNVINQIISAVGGGLPTFTAFSGLLLKMFSSQIGEQASRIATNIQTSVQASKNAGQMDNALEKIQGRAGDEGDEETKSGIGKIRNVLQGESFGSLSSNTQEKVLAASQEVLAAESKIASVKEQQRDLQDDINRDLENDSRLADVILSEEKKRYELGEQNLQRAKQKLDAEVAFGELTEEEAAEREAALALAEKEVAADREKYEQTRASLNVALQLDNCTLDELKALDAMNAKLGDATNYAERYKEYTKQAAEAQGEMDAATSGLQGLGEQVDTEKAVTGITNLVSGLTNVVFLLQSVGSLWET